MTDDIASEHIESSSSSEAETAASRADLERRCAAANIELREEEDPFGDDRMLVADLPAGREKRSLYFFDADAIKRLLSIPFEKYVFLHPYEAVCSYADGTIEALLRSLERMPTTMVQRLLSGKGRGEELEEDDINFTLSPTRGAVTVGLSPISEELRILSPRSRRATLSLKVAGLSVSRHDDAVALLRRLSDALFFQIDTSLGLAFDIVRGRQGPGYRGRARRTGKTHDDLVFPSQEYDEAPMSLYWYARSAHGMPLLQFLAYYQVIEFYFPTYYQAEGRRRIRRILKDPAFRADRDSDVGRVLSALTTGRGTIGDERSMMRATLQECIDPADLRGFLTGNESMSEFFSSKTKGLTTFKLPLANQSADLRNDVADRVYDLRCKIVHTKSDAREGEVELLLPFSKEADLLYYDVDLVQYLAQQVLITASTPLQIE